MLLQKRSAALIPAACCFVCSGWLDDMAAMEVVELKAATTHGPIRNVTVQICGIRCLQRQNDDIHEYERPLVQLNFSNDERPIAIEVVA